MYRRHFQNETANIHQKMTEQLLGKNFIPAGTMNDVGPCHTYVEKSKQKTPAQNIY